MVKEYARSAAGRKLNEPSLLRPFPVLLNTVAYLDQISKKYSQTSEWFIAYEFIMDRLRAVRQDMIIQNMSSSESVVLLEAMIPFYVESQYRCQRTNYGTYCQRLHELQTRECFLQWREYTDGKNETILTCYLLYNAEQPWSICELYENKNKFSDSDFCTVRDLIVAIKTANIVRYFRMVEKLKDLVSRYAALLHISRLRLRVFTAYFNAYKCKGLVLPFSYLVRIFKMDINSLKKCLTQVNANMSDEGCYCSSTVFKENVDISQIHWNVLEICYLSKVSAC